MPAVTINSYDDKWPDTIKKIEKELGEKFDGGTLYIGDKGMMFTGTYGDNPRILPKEKHEAFTPPKPTIARSKRGVKGDLLAACKGDGEPSTSFDYAGPFTEFVLTGVLASRAGMGKKLEWDIEKLMCTNEKEVNQWVKRAYRKGWEV
jgi:hypothetical protein